jgi:glycolate oxidase iron-sulfur subunit
LEEYQDIVNKCSHCGYCQATCPVYLEDLLESHVARNRLNLINHVMMLKDMPVTPLSGKYWTAACCAPTARKPVSSQVPVDEVIIAARAELGHTGLSGIKSFVMSKMLQQRGLTGLMGKAGAIAQKVGIGSREMPSLASKPFSQMYSGVIPAQGEKQGQVAYFVGCGTNFLYPDTGAAVVQVLTLNGWEVVIPDGQVCCGIPLFPRVIYPLRRKWYAATCRYLPGHRYRRDHKRLYLLRYDDDGKVSKLLPPDDPLQETVQQLAGRIFEITDFLALRGLKVQPGAVDKSFTYHVPCHRGWSPTVKNAPRTLLAGLEGAELRELEEPERCCGAAGTFFMQHRELSEQIRSHRLEQIEASGADTVITQCPVCRFYLTAGSGSQQVTHPVVLLAEAYGS